MLLAGPAAGVSAAARSLLSHGPNVALEWGFIPRLIDRVETSIAVGFEPWWFGGDEAAALSAYLAAGKPLQPLTVQLAAIRDWWDRIEPVFAGRVLDVVSMGADGHVAHRPPDNIYAAIQAIRANKEAPPPSEAPPTQ
jgi:hypothetical protein